jgi:NAD(P)-dependent dehydrogenase (short-subunit alcohol dehydrogenase family)
MGPFKDNVVILTGASRGIGTQLAYQLADQGAWLALASRSVGQLEVVADECRRRGGKAITVQTDVTDEAQCKRLVECTLDAFGRIDTLFNNAGYGTPARFENMPDLDNLKGEMALNYLGVVHCTYHALPHLRKTKGRIVGMSSLGALVGLPGTIGYNSAKHAMRGFMNTLRAELVGTGVTVTVLYIGAVRTERLISLIGEETIRKIPSILPERCAELTLRAVAKRRRQVSMTAEVKITAWLYSLFPGLLDRMLAQLPGAVYE